MYYNVTDAINAPSPFPDVVPISLMGIQWVHKALMAEPLGILNIAHIALTYRNNQ